MVEVPVIVCSIHKIVMDHAFVTDTKEDYDLENGFRHIMVLDV